MHGVHRGNDHGDKGQNHTKLCEINVDVIARAACKYPEPDLTHVVRIPTARGEKHRSLVLNKDRRARARVCVRIPPPSNEAWTRTVFSPQNNNISYSEWRTLYGHAICRVAH